MSESALNARRRGRDLHIRDKDLLTGRDCRRLIHEAMSAFVESDNQRRETERAEEAARIASFNALPWWKRAWQTIQFCRQ